MVWVTKFLEAGLENFPSMSWIAERGRIGKKKKRTDGKKAEGGAADAGYGKERMKASSAPDEDDARGNDGFTE